MFEWVFRLFYHIGLMSYKNPQHANKQYEFAFKCSWCINAQQKCTSLDEALSIARTHNRIYHPDMEL